MTKTLPISEVKTRLPELVTGVEEREEEIVVTRKGKPTAVLMSYAEYERLHETLDVLSDAVLMRQIQQSREFYATPTSSSGPQAGGQICPSPPQHRPVVRRSSI